MPNITLLPVQDDAQIDAVSQLARFIWQEHYLPILGEEQVTYMLENFQSRENISEDVASKLNDYFLIQVDSHAVGYTAIEWRETELFVSKLYLLQESRGNGYAYQTMQQFIELAIARQKERLSLTVNKHNDSTIRFYEEIGFKRTDEVVSPIGNGFVMDDYIYQLDV